MRKETHGRNYRMTFSSLDELASVAEAHYEECDTTNGSRDMVKFCGLKESASEALELARIGWDNELPEALRLADAAVRKVEKEYELPVFTATYDFAGCEVDVARFLDDEPECMIDYPLTPIVKAGRVITLCASCAFSAAIRPDSILRRGHAVVALALALQDLGYAVEIWSDWTSQGSSDRTGDADSFTLRTLVKGPTDVLDPARLMFALAHPAMLRAITFAAAHEAPKMQQRKYGIGSYYGYPSSPIEDLPAGTIYLPAVRSASDITDLDAQLVSYLRELEILTD